MSNIRSKSKKKSRSKKTLSGKYKNLFDIDFIKRKTKNLKNLKTCLRKIKNKGASMFANKNIMRGEVVVYYPLKVYDLKDFPNLFKYVYTVELYTKNGNPIKSLIGDLSDDILIQPKEDGIAYWGYFANEPSTVQKNNTFLDLNLKGNYSHRNRIKKGDYVLYKLVASKDIKKGDEITWCYGSSYDRNYNTSC